MKNKIISGLSILIFVTGLLFIIQLYLKQEFAIFLDPKIYFAFAIMLLSVVSGTICWANKDQNIKGERISSLLTPLYSIYLPLIPLFLFIASLIYTFSKNQDGYFPDRIIVSTMFLIWFLIGLKHRKLSLIYLSEENLFYTSIFGGESFELAHIKALKKYMRYLYKIEIKKQDKEIYIFFMPRVKESLNIWGKPSSVQKIQKIIERNKLR